MVYLKVKENSNQAKLFLEFIKTMPFIEFIEESEVPNSETTKAIEDLRNRKGTKAKNVADLLKKLKD